jgi:DNA repair exonuclease SbcCD nuclease subunit
MKFLVTSDWHVDWVTAGARRFDEIKLAVRETVSAAIEQKCSQYFFLGDLMDPDCGNISYRILEMVMHTMCRLSASDIESFWLAGNHDVIEDGVGTTTLTPFHNTDWHMPVHVLEQPTYLSRRDCDVIALPYTATSDAYNPAEYIQKLEPRKTKNPTIVIGHLSIPGIVPGEETTEMPRGREVTFPREALREKFPHALLFNGHYHRRQRYDGIEIPGSLARLTFGEADHAPHYVIVEV